MPESEKTKRLVQPDFKLQVGDYRIFPSDEAGKIFILHITGRGGQFDAADFEASIARFFDENI